MPFTLPPLPYAFDALEPTIDAKTMEIHHDKHHGAYVANLNAALEKAPELQAKSLDDLLRHLDAVPESIRTAVRNNGGGHWNHSMFWEIMAPNGGGEPKGKLADAIKSSFGDLESLKTQINDAGAKRFGSGWAWLIVDGNKLVGNQHAQPGLARHGRKEGDHGRGRLGARVLPQVPEPSPRLPQGLVERGELA